MSFKTSSLHTASLYVCPPFHIQVPWESCLYSVATSSPLSVPQSITIWLMSPPLHQHWYWLDQNCVCITKPNTWRLWPSYLKLSPFLMFHDSLVCFFLPWVPLLNSLLGLIFWQSSIFFSCYPTYSLWVISSPLSSTTSTISNVISTILGHFICLLCLICSKIISTLLLKAPNSLLLLCPPATP